MSFFEKLEISIRNKDSFLCVGIDPRIEPQSGKIDRLLDYCFRVVDTCAPFAAAFKPQCAFFERHGAEGWKALDSLIDHIQSINPDYPIILDAKRGDIGSTAEAYASALLDRPGCLAVTLSPYPGKESVIPFLDKKGSGLFILCRTSNPGAERIQELNVTNGDPLYMAVAGEVSEWDKDKSGSSIGLVVAGNKPAPLARVRERHPDTWILSPGIGAQGGDPAQAVINGIRRDGLGLLVSASRSVADAEDPAKAANKLRMELNSALEKSQSKTGSSFSGKSISSGLQSSDLRKELLDGIFSLGAFRTGSFTLKSGLVSPFYIDLRRLSSNPRMLYLAGLAYAELVQSITGAHRIAAIPIAALPLAASTSMETSLGLIYPRLEQKQHGTGIQIEGIWNPGESVILLDDLITTGKSKIEATQILRNAGLVVKDLVVLIERGSQGRTDMNQAGIKLHSWISLEDLADTGFKEGYIGKEIANKIKDFSERSQK